MRGPLRHPQGPGTAGLTWTAIAERLGAWSSSIASGLRTSARHDVTQLRIFGSASRDEAGSDSDIDLLVDFGSPSGFFELLRLEDELEAFFGRPVDGITEPGLSPYLREPILASASVIFDAAA